MFARLIFYLKLYQNVKNSLMIMVVKEFKLKVKYCLSLLKLPFAKPKIKLYFEDLELII